MSDNTFPRSVSSCSSYGELTSFQQYTTTTAVSSLSRKSSWSGKTAVSVIPPRPSSKYPASPQLAFPTVLEVAEHDPFRSSIIPTARASHTPRATATRRLSTRPPSRPSRPFPSIDLTPTPKRGSTPPLEQFWFSGQGASPQVQLDKHTATAVFAQPENLETDGQKSLLRRALNSSMSHARNISSGSIERIRSFTCRSVCRRGSFYDLRFASPDESPTKLEPAPAGAPPTPKNTSRVSRVILQVPRLEPLLPEVLKAADDVTIAHVLAELKLIVTPGEKVDKGDSSKIVIERYEAARPDSQLLPATIDFTMARRCRRTIPADFRPVVTCSRRESRPVWTYI